MRHSALKGTDITWQKTPQPYNRESIFGRVTRLREFDYSQQIIFTLHPTFCIFYTLVFLKFINKRLSEAAAVIGPGWSNKPRMQSRPGPAAENRANSRSHTHTEPLGCILHAVRPACRKPLRQQTHQCHAQVVLFPCVPFVAFIVAQPAKTARKQQKN